MRIVLDTSVLIRHWNAKARSPLSRFTEDDARGWARELIRLEVTDAIVTPVYIEMVAGTQSKTALRLTRAYLEPFDIIDGGHVLDQDWREARRLAEWIRRGGRKRQLGDCLIRAIADRLNHEVKSYDRGFQ